MSYLPHASVRPLSEYIADIMKLLEPRKEQFEVIYVRGLSGIVPGAIVAHLLGKRLAVLRKDGESSHGQVQEGDVAGAPYIIIDDFVSSGATMRTMLDRQCGGVHLHLPAFVLLYSEWRGYIEVYDVTAYTIMFREVDRVGTSCMLYTVSAE